MNKKGIAKVSQMMLLVLLTAAVLIGAIPVTQVQASSYQSSGIELLEDLKVDYSKFIDDSVMFQLPATIDPDQEISVIITTDIINLMDAYEATDKTMSFGEYALSSEEAASIERQIAQRKAEILARLDELEIAYTTGEDYSALLTGFEIVIKGSDFEATCQSLGEGEKAVIGEKYQKAETELVENTVNVYETGIFNSSDVAYDGSGMVVAVLDTGLDSNHSAFSVENFTSEKLGMTYEDVAAVVSKTTASKMHGGLGVDDVYINEKVPFGYDYADNDPDVYSTHNNHGTHVSGVIVGKDDTITGVAPNAQLVSMKIFSDVYDSAISSWILSALEDCVILGVDVINMSLGTAAGFSRESDEEVLNGVYDKIREAGISVVAAASNSYSSAYGSDANGNLGLTTNPDTGTVGSPSTYAGVLSVASISGTETPYLLYGETIIYFDESNNGAAEENNFCETLLGDKDSIEIEYVVIPGVGRSADYSGMDVTGKIALVRRGDNTFEEKAMIAEAQGAAGIIIYNNVSGEVKMNVGDAKLAVCSISQDNGEMLAAAGGGKLKISKAQTSGPFISDFSSWGPAPSLEIKPEITGHGGNILSSVTGGGYDRLSGTSMACPNLAGVVILLRQYVVENFPEIADNNVEVAAMVNKLLMSTADIALNTNGQPYAVRKQGAGLANLVSATETPAYITTYDEDGKEMDKTKLELGDDIEKNGVYEMSFTVNNVGGKSLAYELGAYVMTEGVSDTKTNSGKTTVTEEAYILEGATVEIICVNGEAVKGDKISVDAQSTADVQVRITLSDADKAYLDESFANGMYVEGYLTLKATKGTDIDLSVPYLAYYGDWTVAPMFDLEYYDTHADELDEGIDEEDKTKADAYATRPIGGVEGDYVSYLGAYYFLQNPKDMVISANKDYIALSNQEGTIHSLRFVWAGLLRGAERIDITITDDTTGEVVFETVDTDVRKSYGDGGSIYPANVEIEFDTMDYNFSNNTSFTVKLEGYLDYGDGGKETNLKNVFEFPLTVDFEAPTLTDVEFYYEYDKTLEKNRLYAKAAIYDNHHAMSAQLGYVGMGADEDGNEVAELKSFEQFMKPVYSQRNSTTYVTFELTDHIYDIKENSLNENSFVITCYDYALNYATYEVKLPDNYTDFYFDALEEGITLSPNEVFSLEPLVYPTTEWAELLEFTSSKPSVARIVNNKIVATASGSAVVKVRDPQTNESITFKVNVLSEDDENYRRYDKPVADVFELTGYQTTKAYYQINSEDKEIGDTGDIRFFEGNYNLSMYPSESVYLNYKLDAYFPNDTTVEYETSNDSIVKIDEYGNVTAVAEGFASVTIKVMMDGRSTYYSETVSVEVKDPYITNGGASLSHYFGNGGVVMIPEDLSLTEIGNFAFANFDYVEKTPEELLIDDKETSKQWYIGENTVTKVVIPEGVEKIGAYAFANLTALEEVILPSTLNAIEYGAFYGCTSLQKITFSGENNLQIINQNAFENCALQGTVDLSSVCIISAYAFAGNTDLEGVITSDSLLSIGQYAFAGCESLSDMTITAAKVKYGAYAFTGCDSLKSFYVNASVLPEGMFYEAEGLQSVTIGPDVNDIGEFAFRDTDIETLEVKSGSQAYKAQSASYILSADGKTLVAVAPSVEGAFTASNIGGANVTALASGAFSHNTDVTSVELPGVTVLGDYAFGSSNSLASVKLGSLTRIGEYAFFETEITELPAFTAQTEIGKYAFAFTDITSVTIPDGMTIEEGVFSECLSLESITIGNDVTIGNYAFSINKDYAFTVESYTEEVNAIGAVAVPVEGQEVESDETVAEPDENTSMTMEGGETTEEEEMIGLEATEQKYFYYTFATKLNSLTIGDNAVIGDNAFSGAASLESVTLGKNAEIGYMAFYNNSSLKEIDLSTAKSIGDYAFSGDVYYICIDDSMAYAAVSADGFYIYTYHAPQLQSVNVAAAESIGEYAFAYCREMTDVVLNPAITEIPQYAFAGCVALTNIDMSNITTVGDYAFIEDEALTEVNLPVAESIGEYAFVYCDGLTTVNLSEQGTDIAEGTFAYCEQLATVGNLAVTENIGDYAFAYTALTELDLSGAVSVGTNAFLKEELTPVTVTLGENLTSLGDNPFALCQVAPFGLSEITSFNGTDVETNINTYDISDSVHVIDGSLYCQTESGLELITYAGIDPVNVKVDEDTVRITAYAFAGSDVQMVTLPVATTSIGHKAFFGCEDLHTVVFGSHTAPILEEEFDSAYYDSLEHIPGSGDFGTYTDYVGNEVVIEPMEIVPYFMWNATGGMYSNVLYGANFVDYVGCVEEKLTMVRPVNGQNYDSFIMGQYFDMVIDGPAAPDRTTLAAIKAIKSIPEKVGYSDAALVEAARAAYTKIATIEQQALVTNYADLISAEQRIIALTPAEEGEVAEGETQPVEGEQTEQTEKPEQTGSGVDAGSVALIAILAVLLGGCVTEVVLSEKKGYDSVVLAALNKAGHAVITGCVKAWKWLSAAVKSLSAKLGRKKPKAEAEAPAAETQTEEAEESQN
ncbi:MAG: leucine-rich repeat protein [Oscillospiraceae bacterium]|nr:leucine-rich repeat protein [Oscillospiraceae bacterium]